MKCGQDDLGEPGCDCGEEATHLWVWRSGPFADPRAVPMPICRDHAEEFQKDGDALVWAINGQLPANAYTAR